MNLGVYIHIPFCIKKCLYCDFASCADAEHLYQPYIAALCREIAGWGGLLSRCRIDTVYIGGGTPTILPVENLAKVLTVLSASGKLSNEAEITVEANPGTVTRQSLAALRSFGVNRLSIGVQAFDDNLLAALGRAHSAAQAVAALGEARAAGFTTISIDLMYGLPGQTLGAFRSSLQQAMALPVSHISVYGLKVEEGTPFAAMLEAGRLALPAEEDEEAMYQLAVEFLPEHGFKRYEISNYARDGAECRHNLKYWQYQPYLGLGTAAHSFWEAKRWSNIPDIGEYLHRLEQGQSVVSGRERPDVPVAMAEFTFLALRTAAGLSFAAFHRQFGVSFSEVYGDTIDRLSAQGLVCRGREGIALSALGMKYGNKVFASFLPD